MPQNNVACAVDIENVYQKTIDMAATFATLFGVDLDLVYVTISPDAAATAWPGYLTSPTEMIDDHHRFLEVKPSMTEVKVHYHHLAGPPSTKILDFVTNTQPRLLVMGTHGRTGLQRILGSCAEYVMRRATCPVMLVRDTK